jgi:hypothetical protein
LQFLKTASTKVFGFEKPKPRQTTLKPPLIPNSLFQMFEKPFLSLSQTHDLVQYLNSHKKATNNVNASFAKK